jgi:hypothetical protein
MRFSPYIMVYIYYMADKKRWDCAAAGSGRVFGGEEAL